MKDDTPAAVIADATLPTQRTTKAPLRLIADKCKQEKTEPPAIVVIGTAADSDDRLSWFMKKPLFGRNIVVTRDVPGNADFAAKIIQRGANPIQFPAIKLKPLTQTSQFLQTLAKLAEYDWIIFTSANGISIFFDYLQSLQKDSRVFGSVKIAAIGSETASRLNNFGIKADFVPTVFTGKELGKQLIGFANLKGRKVLLLRSDLASKELIELLEQAGAKVDDVPVYTTLTEKSECKWLKERISAGQIDWLTFASPSSAKGFFAQIRSDLANSSNVKVASIGPVTSEQLKNIGVRVDVEATEHTIDGLLAAIERTYE
jgi:uroporphyrinogen III methyltransferase/synthase